MASFEFQDKTGGVKENMKINWKKSEATDVSRMKEQVTNYIIGMTFGSLYIAVMN